MSTKILFIRVGALEDDLEEFADVWRRAERGEAITPTYGLTFESLSGWLNTLTHNRWELLDYLRGSGPMSIRSLAKELNRDYKNVQDDVKALVELDLITETAHAIIEVPWDEIETHMKLAA